MKPIPWKGRSQLRGSGLDSVSAEGFANSLKAATLIAIVIFGVLVMRLWFLQIVNGPVYRTQSENNRIHLQDIPPFRGMIFDRHGELLVDNRPSFDLYLIPENAHDRPRLLRNLEKLIGLPVEVTQKKITREALKYPFRPILIKRNMSRDELATVETNLFNLPGISIQIKPQRHYLYREFASHLIGYLGEISESQLNAGKYPENKQGDLVGKYGVEGKWQKLLSGLRGGEQVEVDAAGRRLRTLSRQPPVPGSNVCLTIDKDLQMVAEQALKDKKGAIVAMDPNNGEILAMASGPAFDPNVFITGMERSEWVRIASGKDHPLQNRAITGQYPPGSTFKIVMAIAGLEEGIITPQEETFCGGSYTVGAYTHRCWKKGGHGSVNLHRALVESCDVYFYKLGRRLGVDRIAHYANMFGLGIKTDFDLGSEKEGLIPTSKWKLKRFGEPWQAGETISVAIGQSFVLATPLQMARLIAAVFNGGYLYQPKAIKWVGKDDRRFYEFAPTVMGRLKVKPEHLEIVKRGLIGVVHEPRGTGSKSRVDGVIGAGKTGTSQVVTLGKEKALTAAGHESEDHAWFVSLAPADNPAIALGVVVEHGGHGGSAAAPLAREVLAAYFAKKKTP
ncbi:MAG: penicillin-binding protein 2 [Deltaproteobacteria bacterium HGW-Deltaproteobacteria-15]|jgi:penicillin-binding protein 2|nr:MAG: penicillin-binding protein 2 [Deltaproteobacteria bacterium HGW-Deltaproteobacteria-15]